MPGFPRTEQRFLAGLIGGQRHQIGKSRFKSLPAAWREPALRLLMLLRLAVLLNRSRKSLRHADLRIHVTNDSLSISFDPAWLVDNPQTLADLERERDYLEQVGYGLVVE